VWSEFAPAGKERITFAQALSHSAGLPVLAVQASVFDHGAVAEAIAAQAPHWTPGTGHGYAPRLFGYFLDEVVRRLSGTTLGAYWRTHFAEPLGLDFWIGLPTEQHSRVASIFPAKSAPPKGDRFYTAFATPGSFTIRAFASPAGLHSVAAMNSPEARAASLPGFGGIGTAHALAKFYAMLANGGALDGCVFFQQDTLAWMNTPLAQGDDCVLLMDTAFSAGFQCDPVSPSGKKTRTLFGPSLRAFGHPGAGGSHAFADPEHRIAFAYVMNQMEAGVMPGTKALGLIEALYS
jgi:CubicO group peptidase (beta-lactamase class C family)